MLNRDECKKALKDIKKYTNFYNFDSIITFKKLIDEHFESQAYKFEDLKEGMWVWDNVFKEVCYISSIMSREIMYVEYLESHCSIAPYRTMYFEENRFYPVQMANRKEV